MPRLTNGTVVVSVDDATAALLGSEWVPADQEPKRATRDPRNSRK